MRLTVVTLAAIILLAASVPALAKKYPPRPFQLRQDVILNGAQVPAGVYSLIWETQGTKARVTLQKDGKFVASAEGTFIKSGVKYSQDAAMLLDNPDGSKSLIEIRIADTAKAIVLKPSNEIVHYSAAKRPAARLP
jgi:CO/xanthine dehydrogenase Mo-binding subunit